jgi:hypothetical protein
MAGCCPRYCSSPVALFGPQIRRVTAHQRTQPAVLRPGRVQQPPDSHKLVQDHANHMNAVGHDDGLGKVLADDRPVGGGQVRLAAAQNHVVPGSRMCQGRAKHAHVRTAGSDLRVKGRNLQIQLPGSMWAGGTQRVHPCVHMEEAPGEQRLRPGGIDISPSLRKLATTCAWPRAVSTKLGFNGHERCRDAFLSRLKLSRSLSGPTWFCSSAAAKRPGKVRPPAHTP